MHGEGTFYKKDGKEYTGSWVDNLREGYGKFEWPDGDSY